MSKVPKTTNKRKRRRISHDESPRHSKKHKLNESECASITKIEISANPDYFAFNEFFVQINGGPKQSEDLQVIIRQRINDLIATNHQLKSVEIGLKHDSNLLHGLWGVEEGLCASKHVVRENLTIQISIYSQTQAILKDNVLNYMVSSRCNDILRALQQSNTNNFKVAFKFTGKKHSTRIIREFCNSLLVKSPVIRENTIIVEGSGCGDINQEDKKAKEEVDEEDEEEDLEEKGKNDEEAQIEESRNGNLHCVRCHRNFNEEERTENECKNLCGRDTMMVGCILGIVEECTQCYPSHTREQQPYCFIGQHTLESQSEFSICTGYPDYDVEPDLCSECNNYVWE